MLRVYNTLTKSEQEFKPLVEGKVGMYACGPTVYGRAHIGNLRSFLFEDILRRTLVFLGYEVKHVMNITDVGHLVGDGDMGEDKLQMSAIKQGKTAWDIAKEYEKLFVEDTAKLGILPPQHMPRATEFIKEQIAIVEELEKQGYTYKIQDGIYFDVSKFPDYGSLSGQSLEEKQAGARVEENDEKRHPADFALWKFSPKGEKRHMEWESPWGVGFPGWHIECSAMARAFLGQPFDIHCGGVDHIAVHHENEIAQSEAAFHQPLANYWLHNEFLMVDNQKMSKSLGNLYTIADFEERSIDPLALRLFFLGASYRQKINFTWESVMAAQSALKHLRSQVKVLDLNGKAENGFMLRFKEALSSDLNTSKALATIHELLGSDLSVGDKGATIAAMDEVLGLGLKAWIGRVDIVPAEILALAEKRWQAKLAKDFITADTLRQELVDKGWNMKDGKDGFELEAVV